MGLSKQLRTTDTGFAEVPLTKIMQAGVREAPDIAALASLEGRTLSIMIWRDQSLHEFVRHFEGRSTN